MTDENKQHLQEDAVLGLLMEEYAEMEGEALWREFQAAEAAGNPPEVRGKEDREGSRGSKKRCRHIRFLKLIGIGLKRVAVVFFVILCLLPPLAISVEAFKLPVINYFVTLEEKFSRFDFGENIGMPDGQESLVDIITSVPCPDGYSISAQKVSENEKVVIYFENKGRTAMRISIYSPEGQINIDTEDANQTAMQIHDYEAVYLQKEGHRIIWLDAERELVFNIHALELDEEDFWRYVYRLATELSQ